MGFIGRGAVEEIPDVGEYIGLMAKNAYWKAGRWIWEMRGDGAKGSC